MINAPNDVQMTPRWVHFFYTNGTHVRDGDMLGLTGHLFSQPPSPGAKVAQTATSTAPPPHFHLTLVYPGLSPRCLTEIGKPSTTDRAETSATGEITILFLTLRWVR